jgi:release factor glutamine methyltransferase
LIAASALDPATTRERALAALSEIFRSAEIEAPSREARLVLCAAADLTRAELIVGPQAPLGAAARKVSEFGARRAAGEPLARIAGRREFWSRALKITPDVLDPRPESEAIVERALALFDARRGEPLRLLDLGVGSGALLCALLSEFPNARGLGVDISARAVGVARENFAACGVAERAEARVGDWLNEIDEIFDLIVSNPPYVASADIAGLMREVRDHDPHLALDGGADGLDAYRAILPASRPRLRSGGWLIVEHGIGQSPGVLAIASARAYRECVAYCDLSGEARIVAAWA